MRDNFTKATKHKLAQRVGFRCSNPDCRIITIGPSQENIDATVNIGVAAHICAASQGGARYDHNMDEKTRKNFNNGIWLCQNCAKLIDDDVKTYTVELLCEWKLQVEKKAMEELTKETVFPELNNIMTRQNATSQGYFTGREGIREKIHENFQKNMSLCLTQKIRGLGGVGKTQTAINYAYHFAREYTNAIWILNAENTNTLNKDCIEFLKITGKISENCEDTETLKEENIVRLMQNWFKEHLSFLFIYDNYDNEENDSFLEKYLPKQNGHVLITSRNQQLHFGTEINLDVFEIDEALDFLLIRTNLDKFVSKGEEQNAIELAERLGRLPLALEQAAAYIVNSGISFGRYLSYTDKYELGVFEQEKMSEPNYYKKIVTTTWEISFTAIENESAKQLFNICAYVAPDNIPLDVFSENFDIIEIENFSSLKKDLQNELAIDKIIADLRKYSLVTRPKDDFISIHRLVQEVVREKLNKENNFSFLEVCFDIFDRVIPEEFSTREPRILFEKIAEHSQAVGKYYEKKFAEYSKQNRTAVLYDKIGMAYRALGQYDNALKYYEYALKICKKVLENNHQDTATIYNNIADVFQAKYKHEKALEYYDYALEIRRKVYGEEHLDIAKIYNGKALVFNAMGEYKMALMYYDNDLAISKKILGEMHHDIATNYNNKAKVFDTLGDYAKAVEYYNYALVIDKKVLGEKHPDTAMIYKAMALVFRTLGDYKKAMEYCNYALTIEEEVLGKEHPNTAATYNNKAMIFHTLKNYAKALEYYGYALKISKKVFGEEHSHTASTYSNIAGVFKDSGDYEKALEYYGFALEIDKKVSGEDHPDIAMTCDNIAGVYYYQGDYEKALEWHLKSIRILQIKFGTEHPITETTLDNMRVVYDLTGKTRSFIKWLDEQLKSSVNV